MANAYRNVKQNRAKGGRRVGASSAESADAEARPRKGKKVNSVGSDYARICRHFQGPTPPAPRYSAPELVTAGSWNPVWRGWADHCSLATDHYRKVLPIEAEPRSPSAHPIRPEEEGQFGGTDGADLDGAAEHLGHRGREAFGQTRQDDAPREFVCV